MKNTLFAIGEALIDFIPIKVGAASAETAFLPMLGGAPANVLGAFARLGGKTQLITQLGRDFFGEKIMNELNGFNIGTENVLFTEEANTALAFVSLSEDGDRSFAFYRSPSADMLYPAENILPEMLDDCYALHFCSVSLGDFPMREAHARAIELAKAQGAVISFDPNLRPPLWKSERELKNAVDRFLPSADIVKVSDEEMEFITGTADIKKGAERLLKTAEIVLCTCGAHGAYAFTREAAVYVPSEPVRAVDTTGAGDAFAGSFLYSLHRSGFTAASLSKITADELESFVYASNNYCKKSVQSHGAIAAYPDIL